MRRFLTIIVVVAASLCLIGCNRARMKAQMEGSPQLEQMIAALCGAYAAFNRGDIDAALEPLDIAIEWSEPREFPGGGTYHGRDGVKHYLTQSRATWSEVSSEPEQFISAGNRIVVFVHARVRPPGSSEWRDASLADVYTVRNGKAIQMRAFADRQEALRSAGAEGLNH
jgi:ketosteroid isomerase-like protein